MMKHHYTFNFKNQEPRTKNNSMDKLGTLVPYSTNNNRLSWCGGIWENRSIFDAVIIIIIIL